MITLLVFNLVIPLLILGAVWYISTLFPLPAPIPIVIQVVCLLIMLIIIIYFLMEIGGIAGSGHLMWR